MNRTSIPATRAPLSLLTAERGQTEQRQTPDTGFTADFQELYSFAMDQAIGIEKASFDAVVCLQSCVMDAVENAPWVSPAIDNLLELAARAIASCLELQLSWLATMAPYAIERTETVSHVAAPARRVAGSLRTMPQPAAEAMEHSMDIAMGARAA